MLKVGNKIINFASIAIISMFLLYGFFQNIFDLKSKSRLVCLLNRIGNSFTTKETLNV